MFFEHCIEQKPPPYLTAESVVTALKEMGVRSVIRELPCTHTISIREDRLLEQYLQQSVMDTMPLQKCRQHPRLRDFLDMHRHDDTFQFPNPYWLILSVPFFCRGDGETPITKLPHLDNPTSTSAISERKVPVLHIDPFNNVVGHSGLVL